MATLKISISDTLKQFVHDMAHTQGFHNENEYIKQILEEKKDQQEAHGRVEVLLQEGLDSGFVEVSSEFQKERRERLQGWLDNK